MVTRRGLLSAVAFTAMGLALSGCSNSDTAAGGAAPSNSATSADAPAANGKLVIGSLATEDILPLWVAQAEDLFEPAGLTVDIVTFQSATELIAGVASGEVDLAMTDIMVTASMFAGDIDVQMEWVTLGATADQGRFGIMVGPGSDVESLADLAGVPIGVGSNTILEYVMDRLMEDAGVPQDKIVIEELQKLPVRYLTMASGEVAAAALPGTLLALGEASGCRLIADDTAGDNISQSVMISRVSKGAAEESRKLIEALEDVWNKAAKLINDDPETYRAVLVENVNLPDEIADTYPISTYPSCALPTADMVDPVLDWMEERGYLTTSLLYDESDGTFSR